jgi:5-methyltetrahydrofolate--homocysteine methyltransferase
MEPMEQLQEALLALDDVRAGDAAQAVIDSGTDPVEALDAVMASLRRVGEGYAKGDLFLPDLLLSAKAAQAALAIIEPEIKRTDQHVARKGTVVIGTVFGDLHSIGKSMVGVMLTANGFEVIDLGINVPAEKFVEAVKEHEPDILALSALLTTTAPEQGRVIQALIEAGVRDRVKVIVGGGAINPEFAQRINADGYAASAPEAAAAAHELISAKG